MSTAHLIDGPRAGEMIQVQSLTPTILVPHYHPLQYTATGASFPALPNITRLDYKLFRVFAGIGEYFITLPAVVLPPKAGFPAPPPVQWPQGPATAVSGVAAGVGGGLDYNGIKAAREAALQAAIRAASGPKCECGSHALDPDSQAHSSWCSLFGVEKIGK